MGKYDDIIDLPHPEPQTRPRMPMRDRAAQFSPFAALRGHHSAIEEAERLTDRRIELDEYEVARVDAALQMIREKIDEHPAVSVTYFVPDERKAGGSYQSAEGIVKRIDPVAGVLLMADCKAIPLADILGIEIIPSALCAEQRKAAFEKAAFRCSGT